MRRSEHTGKLEYKNGSNRKPRKVRKQNIVWFNPPFRENVKTNIVRKFLCLLAKHFLYVQNGSHNIQAQQKAVIEQEKFIFVCSTKKFFRYTQYMTHLKKNTKKVKSNINLF